jgi:hypothetical protein
VSRQVFFHAADLFIELRDKRWRRSYIFTLTGLFELQCKGCKTIRAEI